MKTSMLKIIIIFVIFIYSLSVFNNSYAVAMKMEDWVIEVANLLQDMEIFIGSTVSTKLNKHLSLYDNMASDKLIINEAMPIVKEGMNAGYLNTILSQGQNWLNTEVNVIVNGGMPYEQYINNKNALILAMSIAKLVVYGDSEASIPTINKYIQIWESKEYLSYDLNKLKEVGSELRIILERYKDEYTAEDVLILKKLFTKINDIVNSINYESNTENNINSLWDTADEFLKPSEQKLSSSRIATAVISIGNIFITIAIIIFPVLTMIMGIKYLLSNAEGKGELKSQLVGLIIASCVTFGVYGLWKVIYTIMESIM